MSSRRAHRSAASNPTDRVTVALVRPDRSNIQAAPTLYEIAAQREADSVSHHLPKDVIDTGTITTKNDADGRVSQDVFSTILFSADRLGTALLYAISLTMVHFTFDVFVHQQYRQEIGWDMIATKTATAFPVLLLLVYVCHSKSSALWMQVVFLFGGIYAGCYIVHSSNRYTYYAVMQRTPPLGTLWIWCVLELEAIYAAVSVAAVGIFFIWGGYTIH